jgi:uncharacterized membrane protein YfcA
MIPSSLVTLAGSGLFAGILAGFLGIGGGTVLVPLLVSVGYTPVQSVATSSLSIVVTAFSGSIQNWRMGFFSFQRILLIGLPAVATAQIGAAIASRILPYYLLAAFGLLLLLNIYLVELRKRLIAKKAEEQRRGNTGRRRGFFPSYSCQTIYRRSSRYPGWLIWCGWRRYYGATANSLARGKIKTAIQTSLGVIVITAISACVGHALRGNVLLVQGLILGAGGFIGAQITARFLPTLSERVVSLLFRAFLALMSVYVFWQAWQSYRAFLG